MSTVWGQAGDAEGQGRPPTSPKAGGTHGREDGADLQKHLPCLGWGEKRWHFLERMDRSSRSLTGSSLQGQHRGVGEAWVSFATPRKSLLGSG